MTGTTASPLIVASAALSNTDAINKLFLTILSRYPTAAEMSTAMAKPAHGDRHGAKQRDPGSGLVALQQGRFRFQLLGEGNVMSNEQEKINRWFKQHPWNHQTFFNRPHATRRHFMELMGAGVTASFLAERSGEGGRSGHRGSDHQEHRAERNFHPDGRRPQPHRHLRPEGRQRQYGAGGLAQARHRQRHLLPDRPDAETGQPDGQFRHRAQRAGARRGSLGVPDLGADRTQSAGRAGKYRAEYRQHRGGGEVSAAQTVRHLPHVPGAELRRRSEPGLPFGQVRAV